MMLHKKLMLVIASLDTVAALAISVRVQARTPQEASQSEPNEAEKPYGWKASFAKVPAGKAPRKAGHFHMRLQGFDSLVIGGKRRLHASHYGHHIRRIDQLCPQKP